MIRGNPGPRRGRRTRARRRRRLGMGIAAIALAAVAIALASAGVAGLVLAPSSSAATVTDLRGNRIRLEEGTLATREQQARMHAQPDLGVRFRVPSVGLDVPLGALDAVDGVITPPGFTSAYLVRNEGTALQRPDAGTLYVALHSVRGGGVGPGNSLIDVDGSTSAVPTGSRIELGDLAFTVTGWASVDKKALATDQRVWSDQPDRLVIITCLQQPSGAPSTHNLILFAQRSP